jgi:hypothetical protein
MSAAKSREALAAGIPLGANGPVRNTNMGKYCTSSAVDPGGQMPEIKTMVRIESNHALRFI